MAGPKVAVYSNIGIAGMHELTEEQKELLFAYRDERIPIALNTEETDWEAASKWIDDLYRESGKEHTSKVYARSPVEGVLFANLLRFVFFDEPKGAPTLKVLAEAMREYHKSLPRDIGEGNYPSIEDGEQLSAYKSEHHDSVRKDLIEVLMSTVKRNKKEVRSLAEDYMFSVESQRDSCTDFVHSAFFGQHEWWVPYYLFPEKHLGVKYTEKESRVLAIWDEISRVCGWWVAYDEITILVDRPLHQSLSDDLQGHNESGPAVLYGDGFRFYLLDGMRVDEQIVMRPETQTIEQINGEQNSDLRSIRIERYGWPKYLKDSNARKLDERHNEVENQLEALMESPAGDRRLLVTCPTARIFALGVPSTINTCEEAQRWLAGPAANANVIART